MALLAVAGKPLPDPPYPASVRSGHWKYALDVARITQSTTWILANAETRPWLLMLWFTSWQQIPAGSLPADDEVIAATLGMTPAWFQAHRPVLMRKWYRASDDRLYNPTVSELVLAMIAEKTDWRNRQRKRRAK